MPEDTANPAGWSARASASALAAAEQLLDAGVGTEMLAELVPAGRRFGVFPRPATMRPRGEVWRLGVLLLDRSGRLYALGHLTRAAERGRVGYQSVSREERRDIAAAALRGGYPAGTPVNFDAVPLSLSTPELLELGDRSPLGLVDEVVRVRWSPGAALRTAPTLDSYLAERVELLLNPLGDN